MVAFWCGQFLPGLSYFTTPFNARFQPGMSYTWNGFYGVVVVFFVSLVLFLRHPGNQKRAFGDEHQLERGPTEQLVRSVETKVGTKPVKFLVDSDVRNSDAIAFGYGAHKTVFLGKGLLLLSAIRPSEFRARIAHELGHIKNGDVTLAFYSRALVQANIALMALVTVWFFFRPLRVIIAQSTLFPSLSMFLKDHGFRWALYYLQQLLGSIFVTMPIFILWIIILFLEHRALLRTREVFADSQACRAEGTESLIAAFGDKGSHSHTSFLPRLISAHPTVGDRVRAARDPRVAGLPTIGRFFALGYLWQLVTDMNVTVFGMVGTFSEDFKEVFDSSNGIEIATKLASAEAGSWLLFALVTSISYILALIISSALLRWTIYTAIAKMPAAKWLLWTASRVLLIFIGLIFGNVVSPYGFVGLGETQSAVLTAQWPTEILFHSRSGRTIIVAAAMSAAFFVCAVAFRIEVALFIKGPRSREVGSLSWFFLMLFTQLLVMQALSFVSLLETASQDVSQGVVVGFFGMTFTYVLLTGIITYWIRGGLNRSVQDSEFSPWLFAD